MAIPLLPLLAVTALLSLAVAGVALTTGLVGPQLAAHLAFALGMLPLILAAMAYFVPVLTRSAAAGHAVWWPSLLAGAAGLAAVLAFAGVLSPPGFDLAAALGALAALSLAGWTVARTRRMFGPRHRGLDWYLAALGFLLLALLAVLLMPLFPGQRDSLRLFHLHANLLGFIGLTALGTLQVLLPTCLGQTDSSAGPRLRHDLKWAVGGALLIAAGAAAMPSRYAAAARALALPGAAVYAVVVARMLNAWLSRFGRALFQAHGTAPSQVAAAFGLLGLLGFGVAHSLGRLPARPAIGGFVVAFLLPLVSGAAAQLLPVWLRPGAQGSWHHALRARLCRWGGVRGLLLLLLGLAITGAG